jgi:hypothetical protein
VLDEMRHQRVITKQQSQQRTVLDNAAALLLRLPIAAEMVHRRQPTLRGPRLRAGASGGKSRFDNALDLLDGSESNFCKLSQHGCRLLSLRTVGASGVTGLTKI